MDMGNRQAQAVHDVDCEYKTFAIMREIYKVGFSLPRKLI